MNLTLIWELFRDPDWAHYFSIFFMDDFIEKLNKMKRVMLTTGVKITALGYADDNVLVADSQEIC